MLTELYKQTKLLKQAVRLPMGSFHLEHGEIIYTVGLIDEGIALLIMVSDTRYTRLSVKVKDPVPLQKSTSLLEFLMYLDDAPIVEMRYSSKPIPDIPESMSPIFYTTRDM